MVDTLMGLARRDRMAGTRDAASLPAPEPLCGRVQPQTGRDPLKDKGNAPLYRHP